VTGGGGPPVKLIKYHGDETTELVGPHGPSKKGETRLVRRSRKEKKRRTRRSEAFQLGKAQGRGEKRNKKGLGVKKSVATEASRFEGAETECT